MIVMLVTQNASEESHLASWDSSLRFVCDEAPALVQND